ncbi:MAG: nucleoside hydrolase [Deltaproteobacteria bacterium]|nr:nucleoside hydrolase [Deltaproteobacteria bacterium]
MPPGGRRCALYLGLALAAAGCGETLDAGRNLYGQLPVDHRNPVIIDNDGWSDNWAGECAVLLANAGSLSLAGIVVDASNYWTDQNANVTGWTNLVTAARASGLEHIPDVTEGASTQLTVPADQRIESTVPLRSAGAQLIVDLSRQLYLPGHPLVVVTGAQLTNLADAYLMDPTVVDRVTVVAALGSSSSGKTLMTGPNGDLDPWADWIVAHKFHYTQVPVRYDQSGDVTADDLANLPRNPFGDWMAGKQPNLSKLNTAADQVAVLAAGVSTFVITAEPSAPDPTAVFGSPQGQGPPLVPNAAGNALVVTQVDTASIRTHLWRMLQDPKTFAGD